LSSLSMMICDENYGAVAEVSVVLLGGSSDGVAVVNNLLAIVYKQIRRHDGGGRLLLPLEEGAAGVLHDALGLLLKLLRCGLTKLGAALAFDVG